VFGDNGLAHGTKSIAIDEKICLEIKYCITTAKKRTHINNNDNIILYHNSVLSRNAGLFRLKGFIATFCPSHTQRGGLCPRETDIILYYCIKKIVLHVRIIFVGSNGSNTDD